MGSSGFGTSVREWSVAALGALLLAAAGSYVLRSDATRPTLESAGLAISVGCSLLLAGLWLGRTSTGDRAARIARWAAAGALVGVGVPLWFVFGLGVVDRGDLALAGLNGAAIAATAGAAVGYHVVASKRRLETAESRFLALTENSPFAVVTIDETGTVRYANDAVEDRFGYAAADLVGERFSTLVAEPAPGNRRSAPDRLPADLARGPDWSGVEFTAVDADGGELPVVASFGEHAEDGEHLFTGVVRDVSGRKEAEARLEAHVSKVTRLHEIAARIGRADSQEAVFQRTADGAVELFPCEVARVAALEGERFVPTATACSRGHSMALEGASAEQPPLQTWYARASCESAETVRVDYLQDAGWPNERRHTDGEPPATGADVAAYGSLLTVPIHGQGVLQLFATEPEAFSEGDEEVANMLATHANTACERVAAEATIRRERDRLEEFASVLSHDIRNPLNVAGGRLELARETGDAEHFEAIERAHGRIERLIEDVLALARQGEAVGETEPVALAAVARGAWDGVATGEATLRVDAERAVSADRSRLQQLFENLYRNAIEHGGDDVTVTVGGTEVGFYLEDDGPGIPPEEREQVFESGFSRSDDGTGFGLAIVERIAEAHGWEIAATEGTDGGARFEVSGVEPVGGRS